MSRTIKKPNFLIIGAAKSGTTSLFAYLKQHPDIFMPAIKETNFFALNNVDFKLNSTSDKIWYDNSIKDLKEYLVLFSSAKNESAIGEASPRYLHNYHAPINIKEFDCNMKFIVILRNPVDRAFSNFYHCRKLGIETEKNFKKALDKEESRRKNGWHWANYIYIGYYHQHLERYFSFFPRKNFKIILLEDLKERPSETITQILSFLGVNKEYVIDTNRVYNRGIKLNSKILRKIFFMPNLFNRFLIKFFPQLSKIIWSKLINREKIKYHEKKFLIQLYQEDIKKLELLINRDLSHWYYLAK